MFINLGQIQSKLIYVHICNLWTDQFVSYKSVICVDQEKKINKISEKNNFRKSRIFLWFRYHECIIPLSFIASFLFGALRVSRLSSSLAFRSDSLASACFFSLSRSKFESIKWGKRGNFEVLIKNLKYPFLLIRSNNLFRIHNTYLHICKYQNFY